MANNGSYSNERPSAGVDVDYATDPASGGFFHSDYKKHDDLKQMLDVNKDGLKLEAMKRIIGMVAKGRDASDLFPSVVKNVVSKNIEVKKLVYVYLVRYAEEQQDLALLSISTFQRALKDPNQLIRASALRVLSSIRVSVIVPIVMLAIKESASDMSPYVRKTAAHAIPKLYSLDPEQKEELVVVIEKLLSDKTTLVVGSAVMAFEEVCPERIDLVHKHYRKLCTLLADVDEWGQVVIINMLTRYARTQFTDPNINADLCGDSGEEGKRFYDDWDDDDDDEGDDDNEKEAARKKKKKNKKSFSLDPDHRLLLRSARPLLQSRNASVVMSVAQLYHHLAPRNEVSTVAKSLIRLLRSHREVQSIVLSCIASVAIQRKGMFEPFLKSFFVRTSDATHIKLLKLEILTSLATETSISIILREFQTYIASHDKEFVAAAIQAIGRCASNIKEVTDSCLTGLVAMLSNGDEAVVGESVVVIKKLLQSEPARHRDIIANMARLLSCITVPQARASILWLLGEYSRLVPNIPPDVLRCVAKTFVQEEDIVKLQVLNLAVKLYLTNPTQTRLLCQYVLNLARYDRNYDLRDRSRFLRQFVFPTDPDNGIAQCAKRIFLATKPAPQVESKFNDREQFQMGSLSHYINIRAAGYHDLPPHPVAAPDPAARNVSEPLPPPPTPATAPAHRRATPPGPHPPAAVGANKKKKSFYSDDSEDSSPPEEDSESSDGESSEEDSGEEESSSERESDETESVDEKSKKNVGAAEEKTKESSDAQTSSGMSSGVESSSETEPDSKPVSKAVVKPAKQKNQPPTSKSNLDLLLDLDDIPPTMSPVMTPSMGGFLTPLSPQTALAMVTSSTPDNPVSIIQLASPHFTPSQSTEVLNHVTSNGLAVRARFTRLPHLYASAMTSVELTFTNHCKQPLTELAMVNSTCVHGFAALAELAPGASAVGVVGVAWADSTQPITCELGWADGKASFQLRAPIGELVRPVTMPPLLFLSEQGKLKGMNEHSMAVTTTLDGRGLSERIYKVANLSGIQATEALTLRFAGQTMASRSLVLVTVSLSRDDPGLKEAKIIVNCEKMVIGSMLLNEIKSGLHS